MNFVNFIFVKYKMNVYYEKKEFIILEQKTLFANNDFIGVLEKFDEINTNINANCPVDRVESERLKLQQKLSEWKEFVPTFRFNTQLEASNNSMLSDGIGEQCTKIGDFFYHFDMSHKNRKCLMEKIPIIRNLEVTEASDGVYTWLIFTDKKGKPQFVSKKVMTIQEISTKHSHIILDILDEIDTIHLAGEFIKSGNNVTINFLSGTYMVNLFENIIPQDIIEIHNEAVTFLNSAFERRLVFTNQNKEETLITQQNVVYTRENIDVLLGCGAIIKRFDTRKLCNKYDKRVTELITAQAQHEMRMKLWNTYERKGSEPVFDYVPVTEYVDITVENSNSIAFPTIT
jgi:hypothetical protein